MKLLISEAITSKVIGYHGSPRNFDGFSNESLGKGFDLLGPGFYFFQTPEYAERYAELGYLYKCELTLSKKLNPTHVTFRVPQVEKLLRVAKSKMGAEIWGYLLSDWDENPRIAYGDLIESILDDDNDIGVALAICYDVFKYDRPKSYQDFANAMRHQLGVNGFIDDTKFDMPCVVVYDESDISIIEKIKL